MYQRPPSQRHLPRSIRLSAIHSQIPVAIDSSGLWSTRKTAAAVRCSKRPHRHCPVLWRAAHLMIEMFGEDAAHKAALRADALLEQGDTAGFFAWKRITRAID